MNALANLANLVTRIPLLGTLIQKYLPNDKPWFQSATVWAGVAWTASLVLASADIQGIDAQADKVSAAFNVLGPVLMLLGVRKAATTTAPGATPPTK
jgi:arginine exporter protein ArgO